MDEPEIRIDLDAVDWERVDQAALALMLLGVHDGWRSWKGFDWGVLNRLHERGFITDPRSKAKSVVFTAEGIEESQRLFETLFLRGSK
jgi:Domain of unknown function (DUF6429)